MRLCHVPPAPLADRIIPVSSRWHLCVADVIVTNPVYRRFYQLRRARNDFIILDVGTFEGVDTGWDVLMKAILAVEPQEVVLPDAFRDGPETAQRAERFSREIITVGGGDVRLMGVPQGKDWIGYLECARWLMAMPDVKTIGIIEDVEQDFDMPRRDIVKHLTDHMPRDLSIHYLGVSETLTEVHSPYERARVRTCDTSKFIVWGLNDTYIDPKDPVVPPYPGRKSLGGRMEYFDYHTRDHNKVMMAKRNILDWQSHFGLGGA
jgi:hypothetical protein